MLFRSKMIYVPKKFNATINGEPITILSNKEYGITMKNGEKYNGTIKDVTNGEDAKVVLGIEFKEGYMFVMAEVNKELPLSEITSIELIRTKYSKGIRSIKEMNSCLVDIPSTESFTFSFDIDKYPTPYKITVKEGEFIVLSVLGKDRNEEGHERSVSLYGHILDFNNSVIKFRRYISNKGTRKIVDTDVDVAKVVGVYRQELSIGKPEVDLPESTEKTECCGSCAGCTWPPTDEAAE